MKIAGGGCGGRLCVEGAWGRVGLHIRGKRLIFEVQVTRTKLPAEGAGQMLSQHESLRTYECRFVIAVAWVNKSEDVLA